MAMLKQVNPVRADYARGSEPMTREALISSLHVHRTLLEQYVADAARMTAKLEDMERKLSTTQKGVTYQEVAQALPTVGQLLMWSMIECAAVAAAAIWYLSVYTH